MHQLSHASISYFVIPPPGLVVTGNETPLIVGVPRDLVCTAVDIDVNIIEWRLIIPGFVGFEPLLISANNVNELTIQPLPSQAGVQSFKCVVISTAGDRYTKEAQVTLQGMHFTIIIDHKTFHSTNVVHVVYVHL